MTKKFTLHKKNYLSIVFSLIALLFTTSSINAQVGCANQVVLGTENFGAGTTPSSDPYVVNLTYQATGPLSADGNYRVADSTSQKSEWQHSGDHTGNLNGKMLIVNGKAGTFYTRTVTLDQGYVPGNYTVSLFLMNIDPKGLCGTGALLPVLTITVDYLSQSNTWMPVQGSPYTASPVAQSATPTWVNLGSTFTIPSLGSFIPKTIRVMFGNATSVGCGNDFAMDDLQLALCPEAGPMPVEFMNFTAQQKGTGVTLNWSTSQEVNNSYFEVQRSADGNTNWDAVTTVNGAGNSQVVKNYNAFDADPFSGNNYYRIKQVDFDGNFKFSNIVSVNINSGKTSVAVLANPFQSTLSVKFSVTTAQVVSARLIDITGRQVAVEKWAIDAGNSRKDFSSVSALQSGIYILSIVNNTGETIYNGKVVKQ